MAQQIQLQDAFEGRVPIASRLPKRRDNGLISAYDHLPSPARETERCSQFIPPPNLVCHGSKRSNDGSLCDSHKRRTYH